MKLIRLYHKKENDVMMLVTWTGIEPGAFHTAVRCINHCATETLCLGMHSNVKCRVGQTYKSRSQNFKEFAKNSKIDEAD